MFNNMKLVVKLSLCFSVVVMLLVGTSVVGINNIQLMNDQMVEMVINHEKVVLVNKVSINTFDNGRQIRNLLLVDDAVKQASFKAIIQKNRDENAAFFVELSQLIKSDEGKRLFADVLAESTALDKKYQPLYTLLDDKKNGKAAAVEYLLKEFAPNNTNFVKVLQLLG